jgi:hypothetical protein
VVDHQENIKPTGQSVNGLLFRLDDILAAAAATGALGLRDEVAGFGRQQVDEVIACVMWALQAAGTSLITSLKRAAPCVTNAERSLPCR